MIENLTINLVSCLEKNVKNKKYNEYAQVSIHIAKEDCIFDSQSVIWLLKERWDTYRKTQFSNLRYLKAGKQVGVAKLVGSRSIFVN